jgi:hypothetical protein
MSLHVLANHMATKGRGSDSMLVHMTPAEVASLQALAMKNGGSLTINPDTGLPEAGFLKKLLPALAGFALNAFAPGFGTAIGGALGLSGAAGTAIGLGGITGLATGSLSKGLMAGLGAYGGASLAGSMMNAGTMSLADQAAQAAGLGAEKAALAQGLSADTVAAMKAQAIEEAGNRAITSTAGNTLSAGFNAAKEAPGAFLKDNWKMGLAAASPFIADAMVPTTTKMPSANATPGYIRPYQYDANTRTVKAMDPVLASEWGARQFPDFIRKEQAAPPAGLGQQLPPGMASGGIVALAEGGETDPYARYNTLSGQSKAAYDYLMGNTAGSNPAGLPAIAPRPVVSNTNTPPATTTTTPTIPAVLPPGESAPTPSSTTPTYITEPYMPSLGNEPSPTYSGFVPEPANPNIPVEDRTPTPTIQDDGTTPGIQEIIERMPETPVDDGTTAGIQEIIDSINIAPEPVYTPAPSSDETYRDVMAAEEAQRYQDQLAREALNEAALAEAREAAIMDAIYRSADNDDRNPYYSDTTEVVQPWQNVSPTIPSPDADFPSTYPMEIENDYTYGGSDTYGLDGYYLGDLGGFGGGFRKNELRSESQEYANGGMAGYALGGLGALGGYSDGGRLLKGPGDGVSDSIPATIGRKKQPARLADGEFVVPARIVSELGNGSTEAGARKLYAMMDRIQKARGKTVGKGKVAANSRSEKHLPA